MREQDHQPKGAEFRLSRRALLSSAVGLPLIGTACSTAGTEALDETEAQILDTTAQILNDQAGELLECVQCAPIGAVELSNDRAATAPPNSNFRTRVPSLTDELDEVLQRAVRYWDLAENDRPAVRWIEDSSHPDYWFLPGDDDAADQEFELNAEALQVLADKNAFAFRDQQPVRLFGLRGCRLANGATETEWAQSHQIIDTRPDHRTRKCLMGVWRTDTGDLRLFSSSTVPQAANMFVALRTQGATCSLLPTGFYRYRAGTHNASRRPQRGSLRIDQKYVVLRTTTDLVYDPFQANEFWTMGSYHNVHSATNGWGKTKFDSAGCQVVRGGYNSDRTAPTNEWRRFIESCGTFREDGTFLSDEPAGSGSFDYMLLTGKEARLVAEGDPFMSENYAPLRPGSSGPKVTQLKQELEAEFSLTLELLTGQPALSDNDDFDWATSFLVLERHKNTDRDEYLSLVWHA